MAMLFAATNPDRTSALILGNATARYRADEGYQGMDAETIDAAVAWFETGWGTEEFAAWIAPASSATPGYTRWFAKYMRGSASPRLIAAQLRSLADIDLRHVLPSIQVPTLVLQRDAFSFATLEQGRYLVEHIPDARMVVIPGSDSTFLAVDSDLALDAVEEFLTGVRPTRAPDRALATVLFTDIVDSTRRAVEVGDHAWRRTLDSHDDLARAEIERHGGRLIKTTGDGVLATFDAPGRAIRCAVALVEGVANLGLAIRAGLHTGEVELRGDDVGGVAVHTAARVSALAESGEVLVSRTVVDLVAGSGIDFDDRGEHDLKGVPGTWRLFAARL
jgi:class 3 adenylate cyclase